MSLRIAVAKLARCRIHLRQTTRRSSLFAYQQNIVNDVQNSNAIIMMPTGSGKTFVAAELIQRRLTESPGTKGLFFVPTVDLVEQQATAIETWFASEDEEVARYHGELTTPSLNANRVLVSTPQAFLTLQRRGDTFSWSTFSICVFDETHHVLKDHPYRKLAFLLKRFLSSSQDHKIQVLGLSASLTYAVDDSQIKKALNGLCSDLCIEKMCSPSTQELIDGGYKPQLRQLEIIDTREIPDGVVPEEVRKPHRIHEMFYQRAKKREATEFALLMWDAVNLLEDHAASLVADFKSPLASAKLSSWEDYASKLKRKDPLFEPFFQLLENWYVGLKLLVGSWEEEEPLTMQWLKSSNSLEPFPDFGPDLKEKMKNIQLLASDTTSFMKLNSLCEQLSDKKARFGTAFRGIVFVRQRISAHTLNHFINHTPKLQELGLRAGYIAAKGSKITPSIKVSASQSKETLDKFRQGDVNILVATSVAEEGLDVPAANFVISYNYMKDSVELCQREGRARQTECAFVVLEQRPDRPVSTLRKVKKVQDTIIQSFDPSDEVQTQELLEQNRQAQRNREANAYDVLNQDDDNYVARLNLYSRKTKAHVEEDWSVAPKKGGKGVVVKLKYSSILRNSIEAEGFGSNKKQAKRTAAHLLLQQLKASNIPQRK